MPGTHNVGVLNWAKCRGMVIFSQSDMVAENQSFRTITFKHRTTI